MTAEGAADSGAGGGGRGCEGGSGGRLRAPLHPPLPAPGGEGCAKCASFVGILLAEAVGCERGCYVHPSSARPPGAPWCQARGGLSVLTGPRARGARGSSLPWRIKSRAPRFTRAAFARPLHLFLSRSPALLSWPSEFPWELLVRLT